VIRYAASRGVQDADAFRQFVAAMGENRAINAMGNHLRTRNVSAVWGTDRHPVPFARREVMSLVTVQTALGPRLARVEEKVDRLVAKAFGKGGAKAPPAPSAAVASTASISDETVDLAAESLADPDAADRLCKGAQIAIASTSAGPRAISVQNSTPSKQ
jgi:hypothetical protein